MSIRTEPPGTELTELTGDRVLRGILQPSSFIAPIIGTDVATAVAAQLALAATGGRESPLAHAA